MVAGECDPSENNRRRPREYGRPDESEEELSDISDDDDVDEYSEGEDDSDDDLEIPDDPEHEARMEILRAENAALVEQSRQQEEVLAAMHERTEKMKHDIEQLKIERARLKNLGKNCEGGSTTASDANGCKQFKESDNDKKKRGGDDEDQEQSGASATAPMVR